MKCFLDSKNRRMRWIALGTLVAAIGCTLTAMAELPSWIRNTEAGSAIEAAFFRMMPMAQGAVAFRRPPRETRPALSDLIKAQPGNAELYSLRALEDEQQLDFTAAEADWKQYLEKSSDKIGAELALADFYHQRVRPADEIKALSLVTSAAPVAAEKWTLPAQQNSWKAFERIFEVIQAQGMAKEVSMEQYRAWIARYPGEESLYARYLEFLVVQKEYAAAGQLIADYRKRFPDDQIFPVKATAMVEYRRGSVREGLSVYEQSFQPLWDPRLVKSYFDLLRETQNLRRFRDDARSTLLAHPEDLNATARTFYYYQQQGKTDAAQQAIAELRAHKDAAKSAWTAQELYVCARLLEEIHAYPESARYYFALYNSASQEMADAQERAVAGLTGLLLTAPETPIRFGSGELSMYRDIATMDQGPGYLNGILSLILNTTQPATQYSEEEQRAEPYFHRSLAAELLAVLDARFPNAARRAELHAQLLEYYANAGESDAVIAGGKEFLASFPKESQRTSVALLMADAYARKGDSQSEFAIYDSVLKELAAQAQNVPLGTSAFGLGNQYGQQEQYVRPQSNGGEEDESDGEGDNSEVAGRSRQKASEAFQVGPAAPVTQQQSGARSPEYSSVLERYLGRLVQKKQIPTAIGVLSGEIERNPDDPGLYERMATFLEQNRLGSQQEEVYKRAIARFSDKTWYDKLARFYLRQKRTSEFEDLTREAVTKFRGTDLERYFQNVNSGTPGMYLRLNQYANQRFPHNPVFVRNLLFAYRMTGTADPAAWEALLRQHWFEDAQLRNMFFEYLSNQHKLDAELKAIRESAPNAASWEKNPAAGEFLAYAALWQSHYEESAPVLKTLAEQYPAERELGDTASSVFRSLAYFDAGDTAIAAKIEDNLLQANPGNTEIMARIGDIYADRELFAQAAPYWERIPKVTPGLPGGYLEAATIYWDYFDFENALQLLQKGRDRAANQSLYAYEEGAIYENQRDYPRTVAEYVKGALASPESSAEGRLLQLARRQKFRDLVDQSTAKIAPATMTAVSLRVKVLEAQNRKPEMEAFLDGLAKGTSSIEQAEEIENLASQKSLEMVRQHALERQAALTTDPVTRLQLRYTLIQLYESRKDFSAAQKNVEALYSENPKILGVVRSTVDFYWRMKMQTRAIAVLQQAAKDAYPALSVQFTYEAARKSTEAKQFQPARETLAGLLKDAPYNGEYLAAMADTYAQAGDDQGLENFYRDEIAAFRTAPLGTDARKAQIATLRRGLIPALTRLKNYAGAVDQYIELINNFPEDDTLVTEAALYSLRYQRQQQIVDFYTKTVAQSPRDYRWSIVLARLQTNLENYPAAIDTYAKSIAIRPDRTDLLIARAGLEERLMRFDEAAADYEHIYQLAYKDPQWMEKVATVRARQGKTKEVVAALQAALIDGRPERAENYFEAAKRLENWGMLEQARAFAEQGVNKAGADLLASGDHHSGAKTYARIMTRLRLQDQAYGVLQKNLADSESELPVLKEQAVKQGVGGITDDAWRKQVRMNRIQAGRAGMLGALEEMGGAVNAYFTPEERLSFAQLVEAKRNGMSLNDVDLYAIPLAESAGLADQEARWRFEVMMRSQEMHNYVHADTTSFIDLQRRRGKYAELGSQMEQYARVLPVMQRSGPLMAAADAYRSAGDERNELRVLASVFPGGMGIDRQERYFELLLKRQDQDLVRIAAAWSTNWGEAAANYVVAHGGPALAHAVVQARGKARPAVWGKAYTGLVGLYFAEPTPEVNNAFLGALGDDTIGTRVTKPVDRAQQLAGNIWFYYGSRYGEYLGTEKLGDPEDFLPAILEQSPASPAGYLTLASYYADAGDTKRAIADYNHALELVPNQAEVYDRLAVAYYKQGDRAAAVAQWKQAFTILAGQLDNGRMGESFWVDFGRTCDQLAARHLFSGLKPDAESIVRAYLRANGNYRSNAMLHSVYAAMGDPGAATAWLLDVSSSATDPAMILSDVADASWIPLTQRTPIYQRILQEKENELTKHSGLDRQYAEEDLGAWQVRWVQYLVKTKEYAAAASAIGALPEASRSERAGVLVPLELQCAARLGTLDAKLAEYRTDPEKAPASEILRTAARKLFEGGDKQSARSILELVFAREIEEHQLVAANFLGLAEIRLASGDTAAALDLLRRLVVVVGNPFENLDPAAALLEKTGHNAEAIEFLEQCVKAAPWDGSYRLRLAKAQLAAKHDEAGAQSLLVAVASEIGGSYDLRLRAATALAGRTHGDLGSGELNLMAGDAAAVNVAGVDKFYFYAVRIKAAQNSGDGQAKVQLLSHCIIDFPRRDEARVPLFQAAAGANSNEYALGVIEPMFRTPFLGNNQPDATNEDEQIASSGYEDEESDDEGSAATATNVKLTPAQQAQIGQMIGDVMSRLNRLSEAVGYYENARRLEQAAAARKTLQRKITEARAVLRIQRQNATRQPLLHEAMEQDRVVRPRLVSRVTTSAAAAAAAGKGDIKQ